MLSSPLNHASQPTYTPSPSPSLFSLPHSSTCPFCPLMPRGFICPICHSIIIDPLMDTSMSVPLAQGAEETGFSLLNDKLDYFRRTTSPFFPEASERELAAGSTGLPTCDKEDGSDADDEDDEDDNDDNEENGDGSIADSLDSDLAKHGMVCPCDICRPCPCSLCHTHIELEHLPAPHDSGVSERVMRFGTGEMQDMQFAMGAQFARVERWLEDVLCGVETPEIVPVDVMMRRFGTGAMDGVEFAMGEFERDLEKVKEGLVGFEAARMGADEDVVMGGCSEEGK